MLVYMRGLAPLTDSGRHEACPYKGEGAVTFIHVKIQGRMGLHLMDSDGWDGPSRDSVQAPLAEILIDPESILVESPWIGSDF